MKENQPHGILQTRRLFPSFIISSPLHAWGKLEAQLVWVLSDGVTRPHVSADEEAATGKRGQWSERAPFFFLAIRGGSFRTSH